MTAPRLYSLDEIDRMRRAVRQLLPGPHIERLSSCFYSIEAQAAVDAGNQRSLDSFNASVEDRLRTYMLAGVSPEELEAKVEAEAKAKSDKP